MLGFRLSPEPEIACRRPPSERRKPRCEAARQVAVQCGMQMTRNANQRYPGDAAPGATTEPTSSFGSTAVPRKAHSGGPMGLPATLKSLYASAAGEHGLR